MKSSLLLVLATLFVVALSVCGCGSRRELDPKEYLDFMRNADNGLVLTKQIGEVNYKLMYVPDDYIVATKLLKGRAPIGMGEKLEKDKGLRTLAFSFRLEVPGFNDDLLKYSVADEKDYYARIAQLSFGMESQFTLITGNDTLKCVGAHFERKFGIAPYIDLNLDFEELRTHNDGRLTSDAIVVYRDPLFGGGIVKFLIEKENINNIPKLNYAYHADKT